VTTTSNRRGRGPARHLLYGAVIAGAATVAAACGSSAPTTSAGSAGASSSPSGVTISTKSVHGVGTVLVDGQGRTLYMLTSERGGKITCTAANGCTKLWPVAALPTGMTAAKAGNGVQASLLGTANGPDGVRYVTYDHWPLYTYAGDSAPGQANGEGIASFGGTWYVLGASGTPVTSTAHPASSPSSSSGGGYGY